MASLNKVLLIGNLTRDPDVRMMTNGRPVCNFGLPNRSYMIPKESKRGTTVNDVECFTKKEAVGRFFYQEDDFVEGRLKLDQGKQHKEKRSDSRSP